MKKNQSLSLSTQVSDFQDWTICFVFRVSERNDESRSGEKVARLWSQKIFFFAGFCVVAARRRSEQKCLSMTSLCELSVIAPNFMFC